MSDDGDPMPEPEPAATPAGADAGAAPGAGPDSPAPDAGPVLERMPGWVPVAVVAGAVLLVEGYIVSRIGTEGTEGASAFVRDLATVSYLLGGLALIAGWVAFLLARCALAPALEALVLSGAAVALYGVGWHGLLGALSGGAADLFFVAPLKLGGKGAALAAIAGLLLCVGLFAFCFRLAARIIWPYFRAGVALNVLAMLHLVVLLLGTVSWLNIHFTSRWLGNGVDLTETGDYTLSDKTLAVLGKVEGELQVFLVDHPDNARMGVTARVQDMLRQFQVACPKMVFRTMDPYRMGDELQKALAEAGMDRLLEGTSDEEDLVLLGYRPPGERLVARTRTVPVSQEFSDTSALGNSRFRGEGILANAVNEVVFAQRKVVFVEGHGEKGIASTGGDARSVGLLAEALRGDNFAVSSHNLVRDPAVPADADLLVIAGPTSPFAPAEAEALRAYLQKGGSVLVLLEPAGSDEEVPTGLEGLFEAWGLRPRRDALVHSYVVERTQLAGSLGRMVDQVFATGEEFGLHPSMKALKESTFVVVFFQACPVLKADKIPEGLDVQELVSAPRELDGFKPFASLLANRKKVRQGQGPQPGDLVDRRLPLGVAASRKSGETDRGGGRLLVFGDSDFASDVFLKSSAQTKANRTLVLNAISWAVRRDLIAIDPKTVETEVVQLRSVDRDLAFWATVVALPVLALGLALGVWWSRRR